MTQEESTPIIHLVDVKDADKVWPHVRHFAETSTILPQVDKNVANGEYRLFISVTGTHVNGIAVVAFRPDKSAFVVELGGPGLTGQSAFESFCKQLKEQGADKIQAAAKPAAARLYRRFGLQTKYEVMEYTL
jgi:hypothetical protein